MAALDWLSGFVLQRILYRAERIVKISLSSEIIVKALHPFTRRGRVTTPASHHC